MDRDDQQQSAGGGCVDGCFSIHENMRMDILRAYQTFIDRYGVADVDMRMLAYSLLSGQLTAAAMAEEVDSVLYGLAPEDSAYRRILRVGVANHNLLMEPSERTLGRARVAFGMLDKDTRQKLEHAWLETLVMDDELNVQNPVLKPEETRILQGMMALFVESMGLDRHEGQAMKLLREGR